jgi:hypothetical protein
LALLMVALAILASVMARSAMAFSPNCTATHAEPSHS